MDDPAFWHRVQFAFTITYHYLFPQLTMGLAPLIVKELFGILRTVNQKEQVSMLVVEQNASMALELADHAYLIETGRVVLSGTADEIKRNDAVRRSYLGY